jgi:hypothetical protein
VSVTTRTVPRAPAQDGAVVAEPPLAAVPSLLAANRRRLRLPQLRLLGRPLTELQEQARRGAVRAAVAYFTRWGEPLPAGAEAGAPLLLAGHQPELFHPGVWLKNFALNGLARAHGLLPLNLVVDNDIARSSALLLPAPANADLPWPHPVRVPFDRWTDKTPYEDQHVLEPDTFATFPERVMALLGPWGYQPLLPRFWPDVLEAAQRGRDPGESFAAARRALERRWGCHNLEVPLSDLCRTDSFAWFACHLLSELPRFHALYNDTVQDYRRRHGLRSRNHPVPDLARQEDWLEAPFWGWRPGQARRGRLFARVSGDRIELRAGDESWPTLPLGDPTAWQALEQSGRKARSRALTTTLYARLFLADLFIHGIGGGKYDELTDELMRGFYACEAPAFLVLTATKLLPLPTFPANADLVRQLTHEERDLHWNPQRHLPGDLARQRANLLEERQRLVAWEPTDRAGRRQRFARLREVTAALETALGDRPALLHRQLELAHQEVTANALLRRRDYSFCLYSEETLRPFCTRFLNL